MAWDYLLQNKPALESRERGRFQEQWWCFSRPQNLTEFEKAKIVTPEISHGCNMTYDFDGLYHNTKCYSFVFKRHIRENPLFYLALLNSKLLWYFLTATGYVLRGGYFVFKTNYLMPFPIPPRLSEADQQPFISLVDQILERKSQNPAADVTALEREIDRKVYQLYGLTDDEIRIVEGVR